MFDDGEKLFYAIIRKPQEGKTFICLENIARTPDQIHLIITMNTIKSNLQFFERAHERFGGKICVFNSRVGKKGQGENKFNHAKEVLGVKNHITKGGVEIIIMCAHPKRFDQSILELIAELNDSKKFKSQIVIHIDEAHAYVPTWRGEIIQMNCFPIIERIYMYTATPFNLWIDTHDAFGDELYKRIYIVDVEEQYGIIKSDKYFGVKDCSHIVSQVDIPLISNIIPKDFIKVWGDDKQRAIVDSGKHLQWYGNQWYFQLGNEQMYLSYVDFTLKQLNGVGIKQDKFTLNFVPGYCRKLTHYAIMKIILEIYKESVVIIVNGDGTNEFVIDDSTKEIKASKIEHLNEPAEQVKSIIEKYPNRPLFITGFHCVSMSVTLINEEIGNFDNVIFSHEQYNQTPDVQYQLCRFLFNYIGWKNPKNIKKTKLYTNSKVCLESCLEYEKQVDIIDSQMKGSVRSKEEVIGNVPVKIKEIPKERLHSKLEPYAKVVVKSFPVSDGDDLEVYENMIRHWETFMGKKPVRKSIPEKVDDFYKCSTTGKPSVLENPGELKKMIKSWRFDSNYMLKSGKNKYARIYVAYDDKEDPSEYTWLIRMMEIEDCPKVKDIWKWIDGEKAKVKSVK